MYKLDIILTIMLKVIIHNVFINYIYNLYFLLMFQVEIKKAEPRDSNKMNDVGANQWGMNQNNHLAMGVCFTINNN